MRALIAGLAAGLVFTIGAASAQNMSLRAPEWAARLVAVDLLPTTGGRASLAGEDVRLGVRVTIAPNQGGVARVVRYEAGEAGLKLALRRFTGHPNAGWWLWGPDTPLTTIPAASTRAEIDRLARAALSTVSMGAQAQSAACPNGEKIFVELYVGGRSSSVTRDCMGTDPAGVLARRLSDLAGSRTEEELAEAAMAELMAADRAFSQLAQSDGPAAAFARTAAQDALLIRDGQAPLIGEAGASAYANFPANARLSWEPIQARVSTRGDMGWTYGRATFTAPTGAAEQLQYVTVWTRDYEGNWKYSADLGVAAAPR